MKNFQLSNIFLLLLLHLCVVSFGMFQFSKGQDRKMHQFGNFRNCAKKDPKAQAQLAIKNVLWLKSYNYKILKPNDNILFFCLYLKNSSRVITIEKNITKDLDIFKFTLINKTKRCNIHHETCAVTNENGKDQIWLHY